jgi:two-component system chemotaxis response regulator CheY
MVFLITEDSRPTRNLIKTYIDDLELSNLIVLEAENGEGALQMLGIRTVDFVLLDWNLSTKMTGLDILKEIRKMDKYKDIPVIMVTSEGDKFNVVEALKCGANDFIVKPIDQNSFAEKVMKNIKKK